MVALTSPGIIVRVAGSTNRDLSKVSEWCDLQGMKFNASKNKTMIVSRPRSMHRQSPPLTIGGTVLKEFNNYDILGVAFDFKMTFEIPRFDSKMTLGFQSSFSKAWCLKEILGSIQ